MVKEIDGCGTNFQSIVGDVLPQETHKFVICLEDLGRDKQTAEEKRMRETLALYPEYDSDSFVLVNVLDGGNRVRVIAVPSDTPEL